MKKYAVLHKIGSFNAECEREFDNIDDARAFRNLLNISKDYEHTHYYIVEVLE